MEFNPFSTVKNYSEMLNKIALFNFFGGFTILYLLGKYVPEVNILLGNTSWKYEILGKNISIFNVAIPLGFALISRIFKLHDRISDLLGIRNKYDIDNILIPITKFAEFEIDEKKLRKNRKVLMNKVFYKYASTIESKCEIDHHCVIMTMDQLSWYWMLIEIEVILLIANIISACYHAFSFCIDLSIYFLSIFLISQYVLVQCKRYTKIEVEQICSEDSRLTTIKQALNAI